ncbi:MAG: efflux RND transporter periplasmic adaptor subunit [Deltaproteobacteria bacterium]|nr:efflux RND transporter periplasmic adaptor subunit [Deltaproteobacteria bacterium]
MKKMLRWLVPLVAALGLGIAGWRFLPRSSESKVRYETAKIERGGITAKVTASGALSALVTVQVGSQVSGRIDSIRVDFGSRVKKDDVIATIDPRFFTAALAQGRANLASAQANLEKARVQAEDAKRQFDRATALAGLKLVAQAESETNEAAFEAAKAQVRVATASVEQARAALVQAEINLAYTTISSPIDGVVVSRNIDVGQTVAASFQSPTLFTIAQDLSKMQVDTSVSEADVGKVRASMKVTFLVDAYPERKFEGVVRQVRDAATTVQGVVTYDAVIDVDNADLALKPGMTANVTFVYAERADVLRIPNAALRFRPDPDQLRIASGDTGRGEPAKKKAREEREPGERMVWILVDNRPVTRKVHVGLTDGTWTELLGGEVKDGQALVTEIVVDPSAMPQKRPF